MMPALVNLTYRIKLRFQQFLTNVGAHCTPSQLQKLNSTLNYLEVGRWLKANGFESGPRYVDRWIMYEALAGEIRVLKVLYLEFGVYEGYTLRRWAKLLENPSTRLFGFDSFEGLPEDWDSLRPQGTFDVKGAIPTYDDPRVGLCIGWFSDTLPPFALPDHERLVLHLDADLYTSTKFVLDTLQGSIKEGTIVIFDQFCDRMHELRAWDEFLRRSKKSFKFVGATINLEQVAFECTR
jgi:Macrocin-O-methyltransferase (TylF)